VTGRVSGQAWQAPAGSPAGQRPGREHVTGGNRPGGDDREAGSSGHARPAAAAAGEPAPAGVRLTGRGAVLGIFVLCFLGLLAADRLGWGLLTGGTFVVACVLAAALTQSSDLLTVAVSPPALFLVAVVLGKALTSSGNLLSAAAGTLITLANSAPWLLAGTALSLIIMFSRGLRQNITALSNELSGASAVSPARSRDTGRG
jgi:hypothetical protein